MTLGEKQRGYWVRLAADHTGKEVDGEEVWGRIDIDNEGY